MYQTKNCIVCIKRQSQSQLIVRSAVIISVMSVLLCGQEIGVSHNATTEIYFILLRVSRAAEVSRVHHILILLSE